MTRGGADPAVEPRFASAALLTIDTQLDTLDGRAPRDRGHLRRTA